MNNYLLIICCSFFVFGGILRGQAYTPDLSINIEKFEKEALAPKEEVWVVDFWASWCRPCIQSIPKMKSLHKKYAARGVRFISASWDRNKLKWQNALDHYQMPWNHFIIPRGQEYWLEEHFPHKGVPTVFVIDQEGNAKKVKGLNKLDREIYKAL